VRKNFLILLVTVNFVFFVSCSDGDKSEDPPQKLFGQITDSTGIPLKGININLFYSLVDKSVQKVKSKWNTAIEFGIPNRSFVKIFLYRFDEIQDTIKIDTFPAGRHSVFFDAVLPNGSHKIELKIKDMTTLKDTTSFVKIFYNNPDAYYFTSINEKALSITDEIGKFEILDKYVAVGEEISRFDEVGNFIGKSIVQPEVTFMLDNGSKAVQGPKVHFYDQKNELKIKF